MVAENWSAEGGTNGTGLTGANTGGASGIAFSGTDGALSIGAGTTMTFTSATKMHGSYGVAVNRASGSAGVFAQRTLSGSPARHVARSYFNFAAFASGNMGLLRFQNTSAANALSIYVDSAGKIVVQNSAGTAMFTASAAMSLSTWYRIECACAPGTTSATGAYDFAYYAGDGTTAIQSSSSTTQNLGTVAAVGYTRIGRFDTGATVGGYVFDDFANESKGAGLIGPAGVTPPDVGATTTDNIFVVDARSASTAGAGGGLTWSVSYNAGQVLTYTEPVDGLFHFVTSPVGTAQYTLQVSETGGGSDSMLIDIPQRITGTVTSYSPRFFIGTPGVPSQSWS